MSAWVCCCSLTYEKRIALILKIIGDGETNRRSENAGDDEDEEGKPPIK